MKGKAFKILAIAWALWLCCGSLWAVEREVKDVWGVPFGASFEQAHEILTEGNKLQLFYDVTALENGREAIYGGSFFGHPCTVQVSFSRQGMWKFRFLFNRPEREAPQAGQQMTIEEREAQFRQEIMGGNYSQLLRLLSRKYGLPDREFSLPDGEGRQWNLGRRAIVLAADGRSMSNHTTVLTYQDSSLRR